jgi:hypothetical protein
MHFNRVTAFTGFLIVLASGAAASANSPTTFKLNEPISVAGAPPVILAAGEYVLKRVDSASGMNVVQILSKRQDYVYTTVVTIPASRANPADGREFVMSESPVGSAPALRYWFPEGSTSGHEFLTPAAFPAADSLAAEALSRIDEGKYKAARDYFRRNDFLAQSAEGAFTSFLLAMIMVDEKEARGSLELVRKFDPNRSRTLAELNIDGVLMSMPGSKSHLQTSVVRKFLYHLAMARTDDPIARTAVLSFERHALHGDSFPVEIALDRRRDEIAREKKREDQWILAKEQIARLSDCVKSMLNRVGALEYSATIEARAGSVNVRVVLNQRRLRDLDAIVERSHRTLSQRQANLERLIAQRNPATTKELNAIRISLRELDQQAGSNTRGQFVCVRNWESTAPSGVARDLILLSEAASSPVLRLSTVLRTDGGRATAQMNIAGSLAMLADWAL